MNAEFIIATYGAIVSSLLEDLKDPEEVNAALDKLGANIGARMVDEFLASSPSTHCTKFSQTAAGVCLAIKSFLGCTDVSNTGASPESTTYDIFVGDNPLERYLRIPSQLSTLCYSQIICGAIRGALRVVGFNAKVTTQALPPETQAKSTYGRPLSLHVEMLNELQEVFLS